MIAKRFIASFVYAIDRRMPHARVGGRESSEAYSLWEYRVGKGILESYADRLGDLAGRRGNRQVHGTCHLNLRSGF